MIAATTYCITCRKSLPGAWGTAMTESKPKRRWLSFSIRDLLWLTALVAIVLTAWIVRRPPAPPVSGRFQLIETRPGEGPWLFLDTATGQIWRDSAGAWVPDRSPRLSHPNSCRPAAGNKVLRILPQQ